MAAVRDYRNHVIHQPNFGSTWPQEHPFWHNAYIGLGYLPNKYGISWNDAVAADAAERANPGVVFVSKAYEATLRHLYIGILRSDPGLALKTFWVKLRMLAADGAQRYWFALVLLPLALFSGRAGA